MTALGLPAVSEHIDGSWYRLADWFEAGLITCCCFQIFHPETTDVYDKKNMPRAVYCIHALRYASLLI